MKKLFYLIILFQMSLAVYAQTQKGIVKTRGRMINGQLVPGEGLNDATIKLDGGRNMTSKQVGKDKGVFSFPVPSQTFRVTEVLKNGYQLVDADVVSRTRKYSSEPLYLVMETPEQQQYDLLAAERKIRRTLQRQLQQKEDEIDALNITNEKKDSLLRILYQQQGDNEKIIADMAKRYSTLDYDQLDDFYRLVSSFIENGELTRADSLLRTRGDVRKQVQNQLLRGKIIQEEKEKIQQAETVYQTDNEELARRCFSYYESFYSQHQNDSAAYYLELRAILDTTNLEWQNKAAYFIEKILADYTKSLECYNKILNRARMEYGEHSYWVGHTYNDIGSILCYLRKDREALTYLDSALTIQKEVLGKYHSDVAMNYHDIGVCYLNMGYYDEAFRYFHHALEIQLQIFNSPHLDLLLSYQSLGVICTLQSKYEDAFYYYLLSLGIGEKIGGDNITETALTYSHIGNMYYHQGDYSKALEYLQKSLIINERILGPYHPNIAFTYNIFGTVYCSQSNYSKALEYFHKTLIILEKVYGPDHLDVATVYNNIGYLYASKGDYSNAMEYLQKALDIRKEILGERHPDTKGVENNLIIAKYKIALSEGNIKTFCEEYCFTATIVDGDTPARQQGMEGEYILLEFAEWNQNSQVSLFDKNDELRRKPKDILVLKNGKITPHHFENTIGAQLGLKYVGKEERQRINKAYEDWKSKNRK